MCGVQVEICAKDFSRDSELRGEREARSPPASGTLMYSIACKLLEEAQISESPASALETFGSQ